MSITNIAIFALILIVSLILSCGAYYIYSNQTRIVKKEVLNEIVSNIINIVIFVWVSKILLNISLFFDDPMAVIVYPSNAQSFYVAFVLTTLLFSYQIRKKKININIFIRAFTFVFLVGSIISELIQYFWQDNLSSVGYFILLMLMFTVLILLEDKIKTNMLMYFLILIYSLGLLILSFVYPVVTVFGYIIQPYFIGVFFVISFLIIFLLDKREETKIGGTS